MINTWTLQTKSHLGREMLGDTVGLVQVSNQLGGGGGRGWSYAGFTDHQNKPLLRVSGTVPPPRVQPHSFLSRGRLGHGPRFAPLTAGVRSFVCSRVFASFFLFYLYFFFLQDLSLLRDKPAVEYMQVDHGKPRGCHGDLCGCLSFPSV